MVVAGPVVQVSEMKATPTVSATPRMIPNSTRMVASRSIVRIQRPAWKNALDRDWFRSGRIEITEIAALPEVGNTGWEFID